MDRYLYGPNAFQAEAFKERLASLLTPEELEASVAGAGGGSDDEAMRATLAEMARLSINGAVPKRHNRKWGGGGGLRGR